MKKIIRQKKICILSDSFVPLRNSASGMIYNLARFLKNKNFDVICVYGGINPKKFPHKFLNYNISDLQLINSEFLQKRRSRNIYIRFFSEIFLSLSLSLKIFLKKKVIKDIDVIIWYGPSSFLWLPIFFLKNISKGKVVYIVRDLFPEWLLSVGLIKKNLIFNFLKFLTLPQYTLPHFIGVESKGNLKLLRNRISKDIELGVIHNWPSLVDKSYYKNNLSTEKKLYLKEILNQNIEIKKKKLISSVYIGNTGHAQNFEENINYLSKFKYSKSVFIDIFSPQKSDFEFESGIKFRSWKGIDDNLIPSFIVKKDFGIVSLHNNLHSNNLPGKFVTYMQFKLPVLSISNKNTEISKIISKYKCGEFIDINDNFELNSKKLKNFIDNVTKNRDFFSKNSFLLFKDFFHLKNLRFKLNKFLEYEL